jgi:hypothetical protein
MLDAENRAKVIFFSNSFRKTTSICSAGKLNLLSRLKLVLIRKKYEYLLHDQVYLWHVVPD